MVLSQSCWVASNLNEGIEQTPLFCDAVEFFFPNFLLIGKNVAAIREMIDPYHISDAGTGFCGFSAICLSDYCDPRSHCLVIRPRPLKVWIGRMSRMYFPQSPRKISSRLCRIFHGSAVVGAAVNPAPAAGEFFLAARCVGVVLPYTDIRRLRDVRPAQGIMFQRDIIMSHARGSGITPVSRSRVPIGIGIVCRATAICVHPESAI